MFRKNIFFGFVLLLMVQLACNVPSSTATPDTFATLNSLYTASAQTVPASTITPGLPQPTATLFQPTTTFAVQSATATSLCDAAQFLADVTYPDGSSLPQNTSFVKIWRIKNVGTCTWTTSYAVVFSSGDSMNAASAVNLAGNVLPGQYIEIPVTLKSPNNSGNYAGYWKLRNANGALFGIGNQADTAFWVKIKVNAQTYDVFNFAEKYCQAEWSNGNEILPCPGSDADAKGYVIKLNNPKIENGSNENQPSLLTVPPDKRNGIISGQFNSFTVQNGDRFRAWVNCQHNATKCNVVFRLDYLNNGQIKTLGSWNEAYEGKYNPIDLDISKLAGETLKFILVVTANGGNNQDYAIWVNPRIVRFGSAPPSLTSSLTAVFTLTPTPTMTPTTTFTTTATSTETPTSTPIP